MQGHTCRTFKYQRKKVSIKWKGVICPLYINLIEITMFYICSNIF